VKTLVIGRSGQVARALAGQGATRLGRPEIDLERPADIASTIAAHEPDVVINAAAFTAVDRAESEPTRAFAINAEGAGAIAAAAASCGAAIIQISTDYVFAGDKTEAYVETDATAPRTVYGASKLEGERLVLAANPRAAIVRTSWVFDAQGANFVRTMLRLARTRESINVVADQRGCPTFAPDLATALMKMATALRSGGAGGTYHCAGAGATTWADFAAAIFAESRGLGGPIAEVVRIGSRDFPTPAVRPANSVLNCGKLAAEYGIVMRPWREALAQNMDDIAADGWSVE
jgi:dTDP-4-dehydrorhamnose reductase